MALDALSCVVNIFGCGSCLSPTCDPHVGSGRHDDAQAVALEEHLLPPSSFTMSSEATNSQLQTCNSADPPSEGESVGGSADQLCCAVAHGVACTYSY